MAETYSEDGSVRRTKGDKKPFIQRIFSLPYDTLDVYKSTSLYDTLEVKSYTTLNDTLYVYQGTTLDKILDVGEATSLHNTLTVDSNTSVGGYLNVDGSTTVGGYLLVGQSATIGTDEAGGNLDVLQGYANIGDYLTVNISSPNTENLRSFHKHEELDELLKEIQTEKTKLKTNIPIALKISPDIENKSIDRICEVLTNNKIKTVIISNSTDRTRENLKNINKLEKGGLSGKPLENKSNFLINEFFKNLKSDITIIGVGGIDSGRSVYEKIINGAKLVQLYTGMVFKGPNIVSKINDELIEIIKKTGVNNISELVGSKNKLD